jgi:hypothetical protein
MIGRTFRPAFRNRRNAGAGPLHEDLMEIILILCHIPNLFRCPAYPGDRTGEGLSFKASGLRQKQMRNVQGRAEMNSTRSRLVIAPASCCVHSFLVAAHGLIQRRSGTEARLEETRPSPYGLTAKWTISITPFRRRAGDRLRISFRKNAARRGASHRSHASGGLLKNRSPSLRILKSLEPDECQHPSGTIRRRRMVPSRATLPDPEDQPGEGRISSPDPRSAAPWGARHRRLDAEGAMKKRYDRLDAHFPPAGRPISNFRGAMKN